jgi:ParB-like chromosome segregation protein Spo0J
MNRPKKGNTHMANVATTNSDTVQPNEKILFVPLSDILADYGWNVRSHADIERESADGVRDGSREAGFGFHDFTRSFNEGGQDTPVILAEVVNGKTLRGQKTDKKYELVAGFRRFTAVAFLNEADNTAKRKANDEKAVGSNLQAVANVPDGNIKAVIRKFKDAREARKLNARENTLRSNLQAPDLVRLCLEYANDYKSTQVEISAELGIAQSYVSKLQKVGGLPAPVISHWRDGADLPGGNPPGGWRQLPINDMLELAELAKGMPMPEVIDRYKAMLSPSGETDGDTDGNKPNKVNAELEKVAYLCGALVAEGVLEGGSLAWGSVMGPGKSGFLLNTGPKALTKETQGSFIDLVTAAYEKGISEHTRKSK